ncbi:penicillin-binding protein 2 [Streptomyces sp. H10-C2]|uniref:peptidoglycan D,D-transpeptidase FtsI family protein n=1 Tax=unclassified Streptomyces TaxID=2593676 RepID=UPI0024BA94CC|nr:MULTISPECIES: penicillin-binding protein 2 [unclassified Streptomyces]MDJ0341086.1 penicillin-binding protein 2 [Streptomyces sp. PH10-H1]MDJ0369563.1 penicillin-binding protein 2 [Streptomyces sp. H10-C2]
MSEPRRPERGRLPRPGGPRAAGGRGAERAQGAGRLSRPASGQAARPAARRPRPPRPSAPLRLGRPRPRLRLVGVALTLVMLAFVVRLLQVQAVDASAYAAKAAVNRWVSHEVAADRGTITDRSGTDLATTVDAYDITADPFLFTAEQSKTKDAPAQAAELLAPIVGGDPKTIAKKLAAPNSRYQVLARQQTPQVWNQIKDLKRALGDKAAKAKGVNVLAGVFSDPHTKRVYPAGDLAAGVIGFVNGEGVGGGGLEALLNKELAGEPGKIRYAQSSGRQVPTAGVQEHPAVPGSDVELTIDRDIQWAAQSAITAQVQKSRADRGYVIVQDTRTGEILAMANAPGYDPNDLAHASSNSLGNAAVQDAYEPGSVSKLMSMAAVLDQGAATPATHVTVPGTLPRADRIFHDDVDHGTWSLTLNGVLAKSSNIGTILASGQLGRTQAEANKVLYSYLKKFGIGDPTGLGFPGETRGILAKPQNWNGSQQYTIPFGQGLSLSALQATSVYSTVANGGVRVAPSLIRGITGPDGRFVPSEAPAKSRVVSEKTATTLATMLESVVGDEQGTGSKARIAGYRVAGKTGTANRVDPVTGRYKGYTASFLGFAPADDPRVTVSCVIQNPTSGSYFGGQICGPVFKQVMEFALKSLQAAPSGKEAPHLPVEFDPAKR